ncbi:hypothetical protein [Qipengyuania marisflavi]
MAGTLGANVPVGSGDLNFSTTVSYRSKTNQFETPSAYLDQPGYALVDASLVWSSASDRFSLGVHGRNLTDKRYITSGYQFVATNPDGTPILNAGGLPSPTLGLEGIVTAFYGNPRQVFATATFKY